MTAPYADLIERLDAILVEQSPMHPFGCATWEEESRIAVDLAKERIVNDAKAIEALQAEVGRWIEAYRIAHDQAVANGARANSLQAEVTRLLTAFDGLDLADKKYLPDRKMRHFF